MNARHALLCLTILAVCFAGACKRETTAEDLQEARRLLVTGETEGAIAIYKKVIDTHPESGEAHARLAEIYLNQGEMDLAKPHVDRAVEIAPQDPATNYVRGRYLLNQRLWVQAGQSLELAADENIFNADYQFWLGVALARMGKRDKAILVFQKVLNMKPEYPGAHRQLGHLYFTKSQFDRSMQEYEDALEDSPDDPEVLKQLALSYHYEQFNDSALKTANHLLEIVPDSAEGYNILGAVAFANQDVDTAQKHFEKAISLDPNLLAAHINLGAIFNSRGEIGKSLAEYETAIRIDPDNIAVQKNLGDLYSSKGEISKALEHYRAYHAARPKDPFVAYLGAKMIAMSPEADPQEGHDMLDKLERATGLDVAMNEIRFAIATKRTEPKGDRLDALSATLPYLLDALAVRIVLYERMGDLKSAEEVATAALLMNIDTSKKEAFKQRLAYYKRGETPPSPFK
ncbi:MAG: tetratricopeptide repeat protein [Myxococcota bacterium]